VRAGVLVVLLVAACKGDPAKPADPLVACRTALAAPRAEDVDGGLGAVLAACTPCGVPWDPLIRISSIDPESSATALPEPVAVLDVLDACKTPCSSAARSEVGAALRQADRKPAAPWRKIAERCPGALQLDAHTRRFARGTWYALERIAAAVPDATAEFPLPPFSEASTALALPRVDAVAPWHPRYHVTVAADMIHAGALPFVRVTRGGLSLVGEDYPGVKTDAPAPPAGEKIVLIAPKSLRASRLLEVAAKLPAPVYLAATPHRHAAPWPEPLGAIATPFATAGTGTKVELPATATVSDVAAALAAAPAGTTAIVSLSPLTSP
jgi:hypothetical protein